MQLDKRSVVVGVLMGVGFCVLVAKARLQAPCLRQEAKVSALEDFCKALSDRAVEDNCGHLSGVQGSQCKRLVAMMARDACYQLVDMDSQKLKKASSCE